MPYYNCKELRLYYETKGTGHPLLFISGLGGGSWSWYNQVPYFQEYYWTITFDNRGAGRTDMPPGPYSMEQLARDTICLLDHLKIEKTFVVGLSMGGMIALELAAMAPERIKALVLGCTHCGGEARVSPLPEAVQALLNNANLPKEQLVRQNLPIFFSKKCRLERPDLTEAYCNAQLSAPEQPQHAFHAQLAAIAGYDCSKKVQSIKIPTLVVTGTEDVLVPKENAHFLSKNITGAKMVVIPGAGHALHAECGDILNRTIHDFLKAQDSGR